MTNAPSTLVAKAALRRQETPLPAGATASSAEVVIEMRGIAKTYRIAHQNDKASTLGEAVLARIRRGGRSVAKESFEALSDVSLQIRRGEAVGIIGRNGAGKSTLLKVLTRITAPTKGEIDIRGRVGSLLEVGTGFHPELTGRENIYLNGSILGMRKHEIDRSFDDIVEFSDTSRFLDTPVKRYSSGMYVRLAFAVAAHLPSEILLIDEVLAVGDAEFRERSIEKMRNLGADGRTVLFVSHHMPSVLQLCTRAVVLSAGTVAFDGTPNAAAHFYSSASGAAGLNAPEQRDRRQGTGAARLALFAPAKEVFATNEVKTFRYEVESHDPRPNGYTISALVIDEGGEQLLHCDSKLLGLTLNSSQNASGTFTIAHPWLRPGRYSVVVALFGAEMIDDVIDACFFEVSEELPYPLPDPGYSSTGRVLADFSWTED
jgi:lipopolysaccharide transport system ATP-binding protein